MVEETKEFRPDLILAAGGGSVLDAAKSVAHGYYYDGDPLDFNKHLVEPLHALPVATILTLAASGSEMSDSCVVSDRKHNFKSGFNSPTNYPLFSLMDPSLTLSVPPYQVGVGLADMFCHSFERYYSASHEFEPTDDFIDYPFALGQIRSENRECVNQFRIASHVTQIVFYAFIAELSRKIEGIPFKHVRFACDKVARRNIVYDFRMLRICILCHR